MTIDFTRAVPPEVPAFGRAVRQALLGPSFADIAAGSLSGHRPGGSTEDKDAGRLWVSQRLGFMPDRDRIIVTNGTQNALLLLMDRLVGKTGLVLTEAVTYPQMTALSALLGFDIKGIAIDEHGIRPDALRDACKGPLRPQALYCTPTVQNPTAAVMPLERRLELVSIARAFSLQIIEDDAQGLIPDDAPPPIATLAPDLTWYIMGLAKCMAMGMRAAYLVTPSAGATAVVMDRFGKMSMWFVAPLQAHLVQHLILSGAATEVLASIRKEMSRRRDIAAEVFDSLDIADRPRGHHLWFPIHGDSSQFSDRAAELGVLVRPGAGFAVPGCDPRFLGGIRVSVGGPREDKDIRAGLNLLKAMLAENGCSTRHDGDDIKNAGNL